MPTEAPANFLVWTTAAAGHVITGLPIVRRLVERGHNVRWYTGSEYRSAIEAIGATFEPMISAVDPGERPINERYPERLALEGIACLKFDLKHMFLDEAPAQIDDIRRLLAERPADALLVDTLTLGAPMLASLGGPPWAAYGVSVLPMGGLDVAPYGTALPPGTSFGHRIRNGVLAAANERIIFRDVARHSPTAGRAAAHRANPGSNDLALPVPAAVDAGLRVPAARPAGDCALDRAAAAGPRPGAAADLVAGTGR